VLTLYTISRLLRRLHNLRASDPVEEDLRGWNWFREPLKPRAYLGLGVSEVAYTYCPTRRDVWLRRVVGERGEPSRPMLLGRLIHEVFRESLRSAMRLNYSWMPAEEVGYRLIAGSEAEAERIASKPEYEPLGGEAVEIAKRLYRRLAVYWASWMGETGAPPWLAEFNIDGSHLGLSRRLRVDALAPLLPVEVKYSGWRDDYPIALAGYALALESVVEVPIDYGLVILVNNGGSSITVEPVYIGNGYRMEFIRRRDEVIDIILSQQDPGKPSRCPRECPFRRICWGGG
jgi:CRISPR-associated protein Csa1